MFPTRMKGRRKHEPGPRYVIWAPGWDERVGGTIALHNLCDRLNELGFRAALWPDYKPNARQSKSAKLTFRTLMYLVRGKRRFGRGPFDNPVASTSDLKDAIVIYPESVVGNPLGAKRVVRWLLNKPGTFTQGQTEYGADELYFFFQAAFDDPAYNASSDNQLMLLWINPIYRDLGLPRRAGTCHLIRKGAGRPIVHDADSIPIDGLSHEEKARIFNSTEHFHCYDLYTFYTIYAALCGCTPIVVPDPAVSKGEWIRKPRDRYGVAYGEDDVDWAVATRPDLIRELQSQRAREQEMLNDFVSKCVVKFGLTAGTDMDSSASDLVSART